MNNIEFESFKLRSDSTLSLFYFTVDNTWDIEFIVALIDLDWWLNFYLFDLLLIFLDYKL